MPQSRSQSLLWLYKEFTQTKKSHTKKGRKREQNHTHTHSWILSWRCIHKSNQVNGNLFFLSFYFVSMIKRSNWIIGIGIEINTRFVFEFLGVFWCEIRDLGWWSMHFLSKVSVFIAIFWCFWFWVSAIFGEFDYLWRVYWTFMYWKTESLWILLIFWLKASIFFGCFWFQVCNFWWI